MLMPYYIHNKTKRVISAKDREDARDIYGLSWKQTEQEVNLYVPHDDKDAVIPHELEAEIGEYKRQYHI